MEKITCPYGAKSFTECHNTRNEWKEWPPECYRCCEATETEIATQYGDPSKQDN